MENENWGAEEWRQPEPQEGDTVLCAEHGRILNNIDFRSHSYKLVVNNGQYFLLVRHGGGDERLSLGYSFRGYKEIFAQLDSNSRYLLLSGLLDVNHDAKRQGYSEASFEYRKAFLEGRLKKRKMPGRNYAKVWIETPVIGAPSVSK